LTTWQNILLYHQQSDRKIDKANLRMAQYNPDVTWGHTDVSRCILLIYRAALQGIAQQSSGTDGLTVNQGRKDK
jgi:hypothetical protein